MQSKRFPWFGIFLVIVGAGLLLDRLNVFAFGWPRLFWSFCALCGFGMVIMGFVRDQRKHVFWGTVLFLYGLFFVLRYSGAFEYHYHLFIPTSLIIFGLASVMKVVYAPRDWSLLIPAFLLIGLGVTIFFAELGYIYKYDVWHYIRVYWPVAFILLGISLLFRRKET
ncbi:MAG: DUF5668 domain-containing protein [Bacteroidota bacterium]